MDIQRISPQRLRIYLSQKDMAILDITYDSLDYASPHTRKTILLLLEKAKIQTGFDPQKSKLFIEVYPEEDGGCEIYVSALEEAHGPAPANAKEIAIYSPVIFEFTDIQLLIEACCKLYGLYSHRIYKSSLYNLGGSYRLLVYPMDAGNNATVGLLSEYAHKKGEGVILASFIEEHGALILGDNAVDQLAQRLG